MLLAFWGKELLEKENSVSRQKENLEFLATKMLIACKRTVALVLKWVNL